MKNLNIVTMLYCIKLKQIRNFYVVFFIRALYKLPFLLVKVDITGIKVFKLTLGNLLKSVVWINSVIAFSQILIWYFAIVAVAQKFDDMLVS